MVSRATVALCSWLIFIGVSIAFEAGFLSSFDRQAELRVHTTAPPDLSGLMNALSFLGSSWSVAALALGCAGFCLAQNARWGAAFVVACPAGASLLDAAFKQVMHRHRPHLWPHAAVLNSYSFPSGHATLNTAFFTGATFMVWRLIGPRAGWGATAASVVLVAGIGFSRIYLGVHWPSDVGAGFALGLGWVFILAIGGEPKLERRRTRSN